MLKLIQWIPHLLLIFLEKVIHFLLMITFSVSLTTHQFIQNYILVLVLKLQKDLNCGMDKFGKNHQYLVKLHIKLEMVLYLICIFLFYNFLIYIYNIIYFLVLYQAEDFILNQFQIGI